jgi:monoamine oxidase
VYDVVVVGAGAAGVSAAARLSAAGAAVLVLEARDRIGGRAWTLTGRSGAGLDLGCGWLHSAQQNAWTKLAESLGFTVDRSSAAWVRPALDVNFPLDEQRAYRQAFAAFEAKLEKAAEEPRDRPAASLFGPEEARWAPLLNAFSGYYNGAPFDQVSVKDYAAYQPTEDNWRVREGYGRLVAAFAEPLPVRLSAPVRRIEHGGAVVRLAGEFGQVEARAAIVCVSTQVLADGIIAFDPPPAQVLEAAQALPLGHVEKAFLKLEAPEDVPAETRVYGRTDTERTGSYTLRPMELPVIECFFGGTLAADLAAAGESFTAFAVDELCAVFGSGLRPQLTPIAESAWRADPFVRGAYSYARIGEASARARLAQPAAERLFFAGEACSPHAFSTAHGAYDTGLAAAEAALARLGLTRPDACG